MHFYKSWVWWAALGVYVAGLILCGLGLYANIVQVTQGAAFATVMWHLWQRLEHLHEKHDKLHEAMHTNTDEPQSQEANLS